MNTGEHAWMVPHGDGPRDHPALKGLNLPPLGSYGAGPIGGGGPMATKTLFFAGQGVNFLRPTPGEVAYLRAFDKKTGEVKWQQPLPDSPHGNPMTYLAGGKQFIAVAVGGVLKPAEIIAFGLP
jgi:quinoprotein glucose dehydrogenase